jgi:putative endopeptidase
MRRSFLLLLTILSFCRFGLPQSMPNQTRRSSVLDLSAMDTSVDPCVDFYAYSCGGWMKKNPVPADQAAWSVYSKLEDENKIELRGILEHAAAAGTPQGSIDQKIGDYYASCMDEKAIEAAGATPLQAGLEEINKLSSKASIADVAARLVNQNILFSFSSDQDYKDSTQVIAEADQGGLGLPDRDYYFMDDAKSADIRKAYVAHVKKMFELLGEKPDAASADAQSVMRLETQLAQGSMTRLERREPANLYHKLSGEQLQQITPLFPWGQYFQKVGLPSLKSLNVVAPGFFKGMNAELEKEDLATWKAYLRWKLVHANAMHLSSAFVQENFNFYGKTLTGRQELRPRWKRCTDDVDNDLGEALGQAYAAKYFSAQAKEQALNMVKEIESAMQTDIQSLTWMDQTTKQHALEKLHTVANKIGYPDKWRDYGKLEIVRGDEIGNVLRARRFEFNRQLAKIGKPVDRGEWQMSPPTVNAYYDEQKNDINFPAGILQPPLFSPESDAAPNYGDTGATIGHELTHGFDDEGRQFDAQGNLKDWWSEQDGKEFNKRASCISDQYSQYTIIDDIKIKGKLTLGEDVADLGGLMLAYMAWKNATQGQRLEPIDGLTPEQRFFIGYGQSWCSNERDELKRMRATVDVHSPDKYRTNGVVSNMPQFQQAFHCKPGAPMVRQNSCRVW